MKEGDDGSITAEVPFCRICLEDDIEEKLISPCECTGSAEFIHKECLDEWRSRFSKNHRNYTTCRECLGTFNYSCRRQRRLRNPRCDCRQYVLFVTYATNTVTVLSYFVWSEVPLQLENILPLYILNTTSTAYMVKTVVSQSRGACYSFFSAFLCLSFILVFGAISILLDTTNTGIVVLTVAIGSVTLAKLSKTVRDHPLLPVDMEDSWEELEEAED